MDNLFLGISITGLAVGMLVLAVVVHQTNRRKERDMNAEYAQELIKFYNLLYGDEIPPDDITPPTTLEEIKSANKKLQKYAKLP